MKKLYLILILSFVALIALSACGASSVQQDSNKTVETLATYSITQPWEAKKWSAYREATIQIEYSLMTTTDTWLYSVNMNGQPTFGCKGSAYPIPFGMQLTASEGLQWTGSRNGYQILPQMEPYGLYPPSDIRATWMPCSMGNNVVAPVYSEPDVVGAPFPLLWDSNRNLFVASDPSVSDLPIVTYSTVQINLTRPSDEELQRRLDAAGPQETGPGAGE